MLNVWYALRTWHSHLCSLKHAVPVQIGHILTGFHFRNFGRPAETCLCFRVYVCIICLGHSIIHWTARNEMFSKCFKWGFLEIIIQYSEFGTRLKFVRFSFAFTPEPGNQNEFKTPWPDKYPWFKQKIQNFQSFLEQARTKKFQSAVLGSSGPT